MLTRAVQGGIESYRLAKVIHCLGQLPTLLGRLALTETFLGQRLGR